MSFYEEQNPADISVKEIFPIVKRYLPEIQLDSISFFYHGTYNVFDVNNEYIVRVPDREFRNTDGLEMLNQEQATLNFFQNKFPVEIPKILHLHRDSDVPLSIHKKIPGKSLVFVLPELTNEQKAKAGKTIGKFLTNLHSEEIKKEFSIRFEKELKIKTEKEFIKSFKSFWESVFSEVKRVAYKHLNKAEQKWLTNLFEEYLSNEVNFSFSPRISHCDFDTSNILINPLTTKITGVIDFEECNLWDPAVDLLFYDEEEIFLNSILVNYKQTKEKSLPNRMKFFYCRTCVPYLVWGTNYNRPVMIKEGLRRIKNNMRRFPD